MIRQRCTPPPVPGPGAAPPFLSPSCPVARPPVLLPNTPSASRILLVIVSYCYSRASRTALLLRGARLVPAPRQLLKPVLERSEGIRGARGVMIRWDVPCRPSRRPGGNAPPRVHSAIWALSFGLDLTLGLCHLDFFPWGPGGRSPRTVPWGFGCEAPRAAVVARSPGGYDGDVLTNKRRVWCKGY